MNWDILKKILNWIDCLPTTARNVIIIISFICSVPIIVNNVSNLVIKDYFELVQADKKAAETYSLRTAPLINREITNIGKSDTTISNVILLSYHNNTESLNRFSYLYLKALTAEPGDETWKNEWGTLEFIYYSTEVQRIHRKGYLIIDNLNSAKIQYPKLSGKLEMCGTKYAAFYPLEGLVKPIGMVVIYYNKPPKFGQNWDVLYASLQKLASLLDYENVKN